MAMHRWRNYDESSEITGSVVVMARATLIHMYKVLMNEQYGKG
jgi:hypothetical protein